MKIVITGTNGQLGSELRDLLAGQTSRDCFFLDRKQLPLEQTLIIQDILAQYQPDIIIHAAAYTAVDKAESETELADRVNGEASRVMAQEAASLDAWLIRSPDDLHRLTYEYLQDAAAHAVRYDERRLQA